MEIKRGLVRLTREVVVVQVEPCECSQLPKLRWDATCEASSHTREWERSVTKCNEVSFGHTHPSAGCRASRKL